MLRGTVLAICFPLCFILLASPATEAPTMLKGYFGESLVDDIWLATGRQSISNKLNPVLHGPDRIYRLANGGIEIHEVKSYSTWAGKQAMQTTMASKPTYELSSAWCHHWINTTLADPLATASEKATATAVQEALKSGKCSFVLDEVNLATKQVRFSKVAHVGKNDVALTQLAGPVRINNFDRLFSQKTRDLYYLRTDRLDKILKSPEVWNNGHPLTNQERELLQQRFVNNDVSAKPGLLTPDGRLLVSVKAGVTAGLLVFVADSGEALMRYANGDILAPELQEKIQDAAIRGGFVGTCVGVTVLLGTTPAGWCVVAVSVGSYIIVDRAVATWREHRDRQYLTLDDLSAWGITSDTTLDINDTTLDVPYDTILDIDDSILSH